MTNIPDLHITHSTKMTFQLHGIMQRRFRLTHLTKNLPKNNSIPQHDVVVCRSTTDSSWGIFLEPERAETREIVKIRKIFAKRKVNS